MASIFEELMNHNGSLTESLRPTRVTKESKCNCKKIRANRFRVESIKIFEDADFDQLDAEFAVDVDDNEAKDEVVLVIDPEIPADGEVPEDAAEQLVGDYVYKCPICGANYVCGCDAVETEAIEVDEDGVPTECPICGDDADQILVGEIAPVEDVEDTEEEHEMEPVEAESEEEETEEYDDEGEEFKEESEKVLEDSLKKPVRKTESVEVLPDGWHVMSKEEWYGWPGVLPCKDGKGPYIRYHDDGTVGLVGLNDESGDEYAEYVYSDYEADRFDPKSVEVDDFSSVIREMEKDVSKFRRGFEYEAEYKLKKPVRKTESFGRRRVKESWEVDSIVEYVDQNRDYLDDKERQELITKVKELMKTNSSGDLAYTLAILEDSLYESKSRRRVKEDLDDEFEVNDEFKDEGKVEFKDEYKDEAKVKIDAEVVNVSLGEGRKPALRSRRSVKESELSDDVAKYQKWVDYDMKRYGKISGRTQNLLDKAGLEVVKDQYGDYEVTAKYKAEGCKSEGCKEDEDDERPMRRRSARKVESHRRVKESRTLTYLDSFEETKDYLRSLPSSEVKVRTISAYSVSPFQVMSIEDCIKYLEYEYPKGETEVEGSKMTYRTRKYLPDNSYFRVNVEIEEVPSGELHESKSLVFANRTFDNLMTKLIRENYKGSPKFVMTKVNLKEGKLYINYTVNSGDKSYKGTLVAEGFRKNASKFTLKMKDKGVFTESYTKEPSFVVECKTISGKITPVSVTYDYTRRVNEQLYRIRGKI